MDARPFVGQHPLPPPVVSTSQFPQLSPQQLPPQAQILPPQTQAPPVPQVLQAPPPPPPPPPPPSQALSQLPPTNAPPETQNPQLKRRRPSIAGSRGVSNLTPEQLAKKRANDREAQRAIRERTKTQIETLEKRIQELTAQKPYLELQDAIRQKELVEAENQEIKKRLTSIQGLIQPLLGKIPVTPINPENILPQANNGVSPVTNATAATLPQTLPMTPTTYDVSSVRNSVSATYPASPATIKQTVPGAPTSFPPPPNSFQPVNTFSRQGSGAPDIPARDDKLALNFLMQSRHSSRGSHSDRERTASASGGHLFPMDTICRTANPVAFGLDASGALLAPCAIPIRNTPPTCPLDTLFLDFLADKRRQALEGTPIHELIGPAYPSFSSMINPNRRPFTHALSKIFTEMLATFPDISTIPEQAAILHLMYLFMRYCLCPTQEHYNRLPHWFQPRPAQLLTPHPAWTDYLPWPRMRDKLCSIHPSVPFDEFFIPYTTTVSLNWPYEPQSVLVGKEGGELGLNPKFEEHMMDLESWSLGPRFAKAHPQLADCVKIIDRDTDQAKGGGVGIGNVRRRS